MENKKKLFKKKTNLNYLQRFYVKIIRLIQTSVSKILSNNKIKSR